ncbi:NAD(P)-binding protein [Mycena rebaudengoi]|nr:NAD(P)-binding protein [Mycena rebaudengoi]
MGNAVPFSLRHMTPVNPTWNVDDIPDLTGKVVIVTGGNSGIGRQTVTALLEHNAKVYMASRNREKAQAAVADIHASTGKHAIFLQLDLSDLASVRAAAKEFLSEEKELHVLYNNGGIMVPPIEEVTTSGHDLTFATNVLGHFLLTKLLLPTLITTAATAGAARIVSLTSMTHYVAIADYNTFTDSPARRKRKPLDLYAQSKWAIAVFAMELARRYGDQGIVSTAVNPGNLDTDISRHSHGAMAFLTNTLLVYPVEWGCIAQLWVGTSAEGTLLNGKYVGPWGKVERARPDTDDPRNGEKLWSWLEEQVGSSTRD